MKKKFLRSRTENISSIFLRVRIEISFPTNYSIFSSKFPFISAAGAKVFYLAVFNSFSISQLNCKFGGISVPDFFLKEALYRHINRI